MSKRKINLGAVIASGITLAVLFLIIMAVMYGPVVIAWTNKNKPGASPRLPLAEDREEHFIDLDKEVSRGLFPPLGKVAGAGDAGSWITIPAIEVKAPLILSPSMKDEDIDKTLSRGVALYPNGIKPGNLGNVFISAHSSGEPWKGDYRFTFLHINNLKKGDLIHIDYEEARYTYRVIKKDIVSPKKENAIVSDRPVPTVTIMACWPIWTSSKRILVTGELNNITQLTNPAA